MVRLRLLVWMVALVALAAPPAMTLHATTPDAQAAAMVDCPDHAPPPTPCPAEGSVKHAAGSCCPLMAGAVALMSAPPEAEALSAAHLPAAPLMRQLAGLLFTQDPPPPRV